MWSSGQKQVEISNKTKMLVLLLWSIVMEIRSLFYLLLMKTDFVFKFINLEKLKRLSVQFSD